MMKKFEWRGAADPDVNIDYNHRRTIMVVKARYNHARLAQALAAEGKNEKAVEVLDHCMATFPLSKISYDMYMPEIAGAYFSAGDTVKSVGIVNGLSDYYFEKLDYYFRQTPAIAASADYEIQTAIQSISKVANLCTENNKVELGKALNKKLEEYYNLYLKMLQPAKAQN
jgi:hypothetical protein